MGQAVRPDYENPKGLLSNKFSLKKYTGIIPTIIFATVCVWYLLVPQSRQNDSKVIRNPHIPSPPQLEPIHVIELPLPPVSPDNKAGSCSSEINQHRTGCIAKNGNFQSGSFLPDGQHVTATAEFAGAPAVPDPASIFLGEQVIIVKINGTFSNGDTWKCITCGVPEGNKVGYSDSFGYLEAFKDGKRLLAGQNIIQCDHGLLSELCTPERTHIIPIYWETADGQETGGSMRELRLHPDQEHIAWSSFVFDPPQIGQFGYIGRLNFEPLYPRYDLTHVYLLVDTTGKPPLYVEGSQIKRNPQGITIGEIRGFSGSGQEITYLGAPVESGNADVFAVNLATGKVRRLTSYPEYVDPVDISPDDNWTVVMDTRGSNRQMFISAMRGIPPLTDPVTFAAVCSVRNNGQRRFFQPYLIDRYGDRGSYSGQKINDEGSGIPGSGTINDPEWNGSADPKWSLDGTRIVYSQRLTVSPACGGENSLPCYQSTVDGRRTARMMLATLTGRKPYPPPPVVKFRDAVPWGVKYVPGSPLTLRQPISPGVYTLNGAASGKAQVTVEDNAVFATYINFSDDGIDFLNGMEKVFNSPQVGYQSIDWHSDLVQSGQTKGTKKTSSGGFQMTIDVFKNIFKANGTLVTTINGVSYFQPANRS